MPEVDEMSIKPEIKIRLTGTVVRAKATLGVSRQVIITDLLMQLSDQADERM